MSHKWVYNYLNSTHLSYLYSFYTLISFWEWVFLDLVKYGCVLVIWIESGINQKNYITHKWANLGRSFITRSKSNPNPIWYTILTSLEMLTQSSKTGEREREGGGREMAMSSWKFQDQNEEILVEFVVGDLASARLPLFFNNFSNQVNFYSFFPHFTLMGLCVHRRMRESKKSRKKEILLCIANYLSLSRS